MAPATVNANPAAQKTPRTIEPAVPTVTAPYAAGSLLASLAAGAPVFFSGCFSVGFESGELFVRESVA